MDIAKDIFDGKSLSYEQFEQAISQSEGIRIIDVNDGSFVGKSEYDVVKGQNEILKNQLDAANKKLEGYDPAWKDKAEQARRDADAQVEKIRFNYALDSALNKAGARNITAVKALISQEALKLNGDAIIGLDEQIKNIKAQNGFLFEQDNPTPAFGRDTPGPSGFLNNNLSAKERANAALRAAFGKER